MAVKYDLYESPFPDKEEKKPRLHARVVTNETITTQELANKIEFSSSLTIGDVEAVLSALSHYFVDMLKKGKRVHLEGIGYFQMTLECKSSQVRDKIRAEDISFKSVAFRAEKSVKDELKKTKFVRAKYKKHSLKLSDADIEKTLEEYFKDHSYITRAMFEELCGFTNATALRRIKKLIENGKLKKGGAKRFPVYEWNGTKEEVE